jgi:PAS domain S-box-containing protein
MHPKIENLISKYFRGKDIPLAYVDLFNGVNEILDQEVTAIEILRTLQETLQLLCIPFNAKDCVQQADPLLPAASAIKNAFADRAIREQQLLQEMRHLKTTQNIATAGSWEITLINAEERVTTFVSDEHYTLLGLTPGATGISYDHYFDLVHPDDKAFLFNEVENAITQMGRYDIEYRIMKQGAERTVREIGEVVVSGSGEPPKLIGVTIDLTDITSTERALAKANMQLRTLFDTMHEVFFSVNVEQEKVVHISPTCLQLFGYAPEEFMNNRGLWFDIIIDEDKPRVFENNLELQRGEASTTEYRICHKNGEIRWIGSRRIPTLNGDGLLVRIDGISSDITKRKAAELALAHSEFKFRSLLENANDATTVMNTDLNFVFVSESLSQIIGYTVSEVIGASLLDYIHPDNHEKIRHSIRTLSQQPGMSLPFETTFRVKNGNWIWIEGFVTNHVQDSVIKGYVASFWDATEKIRHRKALEHSNERLKRINGELDRFVYSVSHDLRAPLASVLGLIEYTTSETEQEDLLLNLEMMKESIKKLDIFILDILDYSRNARLEVKKQHINFSELVAGVSSNLKFMSTGNAAVKMRTNIEGDGLFQSDASRIAIIINNLISNAIRYADPLKQEPLVDVEVVASSDAASIAIRDNGIGIDKEYHQKVFDMFFRLSEKSNGSGLGLYLVKETVERLNGHLELDSEPGVGTAFKIFLPGENHNMTNN